MKACKCGPNTTFCGRCGCESNPSGPGHKHNGDRCGGYCGEALTRCVMHGGGTPTALMKAKQTMALLRMPAIEALYRVIEHMMVLLEQHAAKTCPACGYPSMDIDEMEAVTKTALVITKSAQTVLDRCDMGPKATLEVKQQDGDLDINAMMDFERDELFAALAAVRAIKERVRRRLSGLPAVMSIPAGAGTGEVITVDSKTSDEQSSEIRSAEADDTGKG